MFTGSGVGSEAFSAAPPGTRRTSASFPEIRLGNPPVRLDNGRWRIYWNAVPGTIYQLQRAEGDRIQADPTNWVEVVTLTAVETSVSAEDSTPASLGQRFYRVAASVSGFRPWMLLPARLPAGGWRLAWTSLAPKHYTLQRLLIDALPGAATQWEDLESIIATGAITSIDDINPDLAGRGFYRVVQSDDLPPLGLTVSKPTADPATPSGEGLVTLTATAADETGVSEVSFLDGGTELGAATRIENDTWRFLWPVSARINGSHVLTARAMNLAGGVRTSEALLLTLNIGTTQAKWFLGNIPLTADRFETNGTLVVPNGNVHLGLVNMAPDTTVVPDLQKGTLTGHGKVILPGLGTVFDGAFEVDLSSGWLRSPSATSGATLADSTAATPVQLSSRVRLMPRRMEVNVTSGALRGDGTIDFEVPGPDQGTLHADGTFTYNPATFSVAILGTVDWRGTTGTGKLTVRLSDSAFLLSGTLNVPTAGGGSTALSHATLELRPVAGLSPTVVVAGERQTPGGFEDVLGELNTGGQATLQTDTTTPAEVRDDPARFAPLGANGEPQNGVPLRARADGTLGPLEYRPGGASLSGAGQQFFLRFPAGARFLTGANGSSLEFVQAQAGFGVSSPLQLAEPLERRSGPTKHLAIGPLDFVTLMSLFERNPNDGVAVRVLDRLPLLWKGGTLRADGILGAHFGMASSGLALPALAGGFPDLVLDLTRRDGFRIPLSGAFDLPDGSASPGRLSIPPSHPLWLGVRADGQLSLSGRVQVSFPGSGPKFSADVKLDDPYYDLQIAANGVSLSLLDGLANQLPTGADGCVPSDGPLTAGQLSGALDCLRQRDQAYANFSASAVAASDDPTAPAPSGAAPEGFSTLTGVLDAWAFSVLAGASPTLAADQRSAVFRQTGQGALAARDLENILSARLALERARKAGLREGGASDFDAAVDACLAAAKRGADDQDAVASLRGLQAALATLLETEGLLQNLSANPARAVIGDPDLRPAMIRALRGFLDRFTTSLGVMAQVFTPAANPAIGAMNRASARETLSQLLDVLANAQKLGIEAGFSPAVPELKVQLALRLAATLDETLTIAEADHDYRGFVHAAESWIELVAYRRAGWFSDLPSSSLARLPDDATLPGLATRLDGVLRSDRTLISGDYLPRSLGAEARLLSSVVTGLPGAEPIVALTFRPAWDRMEASLTGLLMDVTTTTNLAGTVDLLQAGSLHAGLGDLLGYSPAAPWESEPRLVKVVDRIVELAAQQLGWSELHRAQNTLLEAADVSLLEATPPALVRGRFYAAQTARVLSAARSVAVALWTAQKASRGGVLPVADLLLPGDLHVEQASGAVRYHRVTRELQGSFSGKLRLPKFDLSLTLANASFSSGGAFDLNAYGSIVLPSTDNAIGRLTITPEHPLHVGFQAPNKLEFSGGARFELNGMTFEGFIALENPEYAFGLSAEGIRFDLADSVKLYLPPLPADQVFDAATGRDLNAYFRSVNATLEGARGAGSTANQGSVGLASGRAGLQSTSGNPPDYLPGFVATPIDAVESFANAVLANDRLGIARDYSATMAHFGRQLSQLANYLRSAPPERLGTAQLLVRVEVIRRLCEAYRSLKENPNRAAYDELARSGQLADFVAQTHRSLLDLLASNDPRLAEHVVDIVQITGSFFTQIRCFLEDTTIEPFPGQSLADQLDEVVAAFGAFLERQEPLLFGQLGLSLSSGEPLVGWDVIHRGDFLTRPAELANTAALAQRLRDHSEPVSQFIWDQASEANRRTLGDTAVSAEQQSLALVAELNRVIAASGLYDPNRFARVTLSDATAAMLKSGVAAADVPKLNRLLLSDTFPVELTGRLDILTRERLKTISQAFATFLEKSQMLGLPPRASYRGALSSASLRRRELVYARILQLVPTDPTKALALLNHLRHELHPPPRGVFSPPDVVELLDLYAELRELRNDGMEIVQLSQSAFEWPTSSIYQPYGADAPFELAQEEDNLMRAWQLAVLFADNRDQRGTPLDNGRDNRVFLREPVTRTDTNGVPYQGILETRLDLIKLYDKDYDPRFKETKYARDLVARQENLKRAEQEAALSIYRQAERRLLQRRTVEKQVPAVEALDDLVGILAYAQRQPAVPDGEPIDPAAVRLALHGLVNAVIDAARGNAPALQAAGTSAAQGSWLPLSDFSRILLDASENEAFAGADDQTLDFRTQSSALIRAAAAVAARLQQLLPAARPVDLTLPGNLVIDRIYGEVQYRKDTGLLAGKFGGRLEFPENDAYFELTEASIDSQGHFSFKAGLESPLPIGGVRIKASVTATGRGRPNPDPTLPSIPGDQEFSLSGSGTLYLPRSGTRTQEYACDISYSTQTKVLSFDSQANNIDLELGSHVVLFGAGLGFRLGGLSPDGIRLRSGELDFGGSAGLFRKDPAPVPDQVSERNYRLVASQVRTKFVFREDGLDLSLTGGTLKLPEIFSPSICGTNSLSTGERATIQIRSEEPILVSLGLAPAQGGNPPVITFARFSGALALHDVGVKVPQLDGLAGEICDGVLRFPNVQIANQSITLDQLPQLEIALGKLQIPLPPGETSRLEVVHFNWTLDGFPSGTIRLAQNLRLLDQGGLTVTLLGATNTECKADDGVTPLATGITVFPGDDRAFPPALPSFRLDGGIQLSLPLSALTTTSSPPNRVAGVACGSLNVHPDRAPELVLSTLAIGGTFHLGANGPVIKDASISLEQLQNIFQLGNGREFIARIAGTLQIPQGPSFTLDNARLTFFDSHVLPRLGLDGMAVDNRNFTLMQRLPIRVQSASFHFKDSDLTPDQLFRPDNLEFKLSADVSIPPAPRQPYFTGRVDDLAVTFSEQGIPQIQGIDGFGMGVGGLKMPPIKELGGRLYLGGLRAQDASGLPDLNRIFLVGRLGGSYQGYQVIVQSAFTLQGPIGLCLDVNAGAAGIPLGPTGFLFTGASGGISFVNSSGDPCDFKTYFAADSQGNLTGPSTATVPIPTMSWEELGQMVQRVEAAEAIFQQFQPPPLSSAPAVSPRNVAPLSSGATASSPSSSGGLPCPGDCPPATVNIFCQPHPDQAAFPGKIIAKFSSIDETLLNAIGIDRAAVEGLGTDTAALAEMVAQTIRTELEQLTPPPLSPPLSPQVQDQLQTLSTRVFDSLELSLKDLLDHELRGAAASQYYDRIKALAYAGLPCPDATMAVSGTFSYTGVSSFASVTGKGILSTAGSAGVMGTLNVIGVPVGEAKVFVAATDAQGDPNPSLCGSVGFEFGPLSIGEVKLAYECPGCVTGMLKGFGSLAVRLAQYSPDLFRTIVRHVAPDLQTGTLSIADILAALSPAQRLGFLAELGRIPASELPADLPQVFFDGLSQVWDQINPRYTLCGVVQPTLFGLPIAPKAVAFSAFATKSEGAGSLKFSPSMLLSYFLPIFPADEATLTYDLQYPDPVKFLLGGLAGRFASAESAQAYAKDNLDYLLQNTVFGIDYTFSPLGLKVATAQARVIIPNLTEHPERLLPSDPRHWRAPESLATPVPNLPSRQDVLLAAAAGSYLGNAFLWKGTTNDLFKVYPEGSPERAALAGRSLQRDYFPHGGVLGAGLLTVPRILTATPPFAEYQTLANTGANPLDRLGAAAKIISEYVLKTETNGTLAFYIPAPNPPIFFAADGQLLGQSELDPISQGSSASKLLDSIRSFDVTRIQAANLYSIQYAFLRGYVDGQFLGVPIARAEVIGVPPGTGGDAYIQVNAGVATNTWVNQFVDTASLNFVLRQTPRTNVADRFTALLAQIASLTNQPSSTVTELEAAAVEALTSLAAEVPSVALEADLENLHVPSTLASYLSAPSGSVSYRLLAYSPRFNPSAVGNTPKARAQRDGGIVMTGGFNFAGLARVDQAELALTPKPTGPPALAGHFSNVGFTLPGGVSFSGGEADFNTEPSAGQPFFGGRGSLTPISLGALPARIVPLNPGTPKLAGSVQVVRLGDGTSATRFSIDPARVEFPRIGTGQTIRLYGSDTTKPFSFSTAGPWTATASLEGGLRLYDPSGLIEVLRIVSTTPLVGTLDGIGVSTGTLTVQFPAGITFTAFAGRPVERTLSLGAASAPRLVLRSDGTYELTGALAADLGLSGMPFSSFSAGGTVRLTQDGITVTGTVAGSTIPGFSSTSANGLLTVTSLGSTLTGSAKVGPLQFGVFRLEPLSGPTFDASFDAGQVRLPGGVRLVCAGLFTNTLAPINLSRDGDFRVSFGPAPLAFRGFGFEAVQFTALHTNGVFALTNFTATVVLPGLSPGFALSGYLDSLGGVSLSGDSSATSLNGFPVGALSGSLERGPASYQAAVAHDTPLAYWRLEERSGTAAVSETGSKLAGTYKGGVTLGTTGAFTGSRAASFNGKSAYIAINELTPFDAIRNALTIEAWFRVDAFTQIWSALIAKGDSSWRLQGNGNLNTLAFDTDGLNPPYLAGTRLVNDGRWHHVVAAYDGRAKYLWIDGELDAWTPATGSIAPNAQPVLIGENAEAPGRFWPGSIDEVAVYSRSLGPAEVLAHYEAGGGLVFRGRLSLNLPGVSLPGLAGTLSSSGAFALMGGPASATLGGFGVTGASFSLAKSASGTPILLAGGDLSLPGLPAARLTGMIGPLAELDLSASLANASLVGLDFTDVGLQLAGSSGAASLGLRGKLNITDLGTLIFAGSAAANGDLSLTNEFTTSSTLFSYPVNGWKFVIDRKAMDYRWVIAGVPLKSKDLGSNPLAYWRLGEASGITAADSKKVSLPSSRIPGTYTGGVTLAQPGALIGGGDTAAHFDGSSGFVTAGSESAFDFTRALSVEAWIKVPAWTHPWQAIVTKGDTSWRLSRYSEQSQVSFDTSSAAGAHSLPSLRPLNDNEWHHLVATYDGFVKCLYVDGSLEGVAPYRETLQQNDQPVMLGANSEAGGRQLNGWLDEVAVYGRALPASEVLSHYVASGRAGIRAGVKLGLPGLPQVDLAGSLRPDGNLCALVNGIPLGLVGFSLDNATLVLTRAPGRSATAVVGGSLSTALGSFTMAGTLPSGGNYSLQGEASGALNIGGRVLTYSTPAVITRSDLQVSGVLAYGSLNFSATAKLVSGSSPSLSGSTSNSTDWRPFGRTLSGSPGHPYAKLDWSASATIDPTTKTISATVSGTITVEYEKFGGGYSQESFPFPSINLPDTGNISVQPGKTFQDVSLFPFTLP